MDREQRLKLLAELVEQIETLQAERDAEIGKVSRTHKMNLIVDKLDVREKYKRLINPLHSKRHYYGQIERSQQYTENHPDRHREACKRYYEKEQRKVQ